MMVINYEKKFNAPSQMNERQSSHETCTRVAADGDVAADEAMTEFVAKEEHGPPPPPPPENDVLDPPREEDRGGGGALQ